jgi:hypothetical protein
MVALGLLVLMKNRAAEDFAEWFIASYMIMFGTILFIYEILWWCSIGALNRAIRKNFGELPATKAMPLDSTWLKRYY